CLPAIIVGLAFHEYAHAWAAYRLGDDTAARLGRLTLNPLPHLDPIGFLLLMLGGFGWAKPVPINPVRFNRKFTLRQGTALVSLAGPAMNLLIAVVAAVGIRMILKSNNPVSFNGLLTILTPFVGINLGLMVFNLLPIPPLDGSKILASVLSYQQAEKYVYSMDKYGMIILVLIVFSGFSRLILRPIVSIISQLLLGVG
ncbi:MAG: site-2 protease family protein, partial [Candidatus Saccharibacteria bacterium]